MHSPDETRAAFERLIQLDAQGRHELLDEIGSRDPGLRTRLQRLLELDDAESPSVEFEPLHEAGLVSAAWERPAPHSAPAEIAGYRVVRRIAAGGVGVVFEVELPEGQHAALKILHPTLSSPIVIERFQRESEALSRCDHPYVATALGSGHVDNGYGVQPYVLLELIAGQPITRVVQSWALADRLDLLIRIGEGLRHVHAREVVHGDIKPANVLVREDRTPCIVDFGLAKIAAVSGPKCCTTWDWSGTLQYMSPEQFGLSGSEIDHRSDLYAFGLLIYETLAGKLPYDLAGVSLSRALSLVQSARIAPLELASRAASRELDAIVQTALQRRPEARYQTADELVSDLRRASDAHRSPRRGSLGRLALDHLQHAARRPWRTRGRARRRLMGAALFAVVVLVFVQYDQVRRASGSQRGLGGQVASVQPAAGPPYGPHAASRESMAEWARYRHDWSWGQWARLIESTEGVLAELDASGEADPGRQFAAYLYRAAGLAGLGRLDEADESLRAADLAREEIAESELRTIWTQALTLSVLVYVGRIDDAQTRAELAQEALDTHRGYLLATFTPGWVDAAQGETIVMRATIDLLAGDHESYLAHLRAFRPYILNARYSQITAPWFLLTNVGRRDLADVLAQDFLDLLTEDHAEGIHAYDRYRARVLLHLGGSRWLEGDLEPAHDMFAQALELLRGFGQGADIERTRCFQSLGVILRDLGRLDEAEQHVRQAYEARRRRLGKDAAWTVDSAITLAKCLYFAGKHEEALEYAHEAHAGNTRQRTGREADWIESATLLAHLYIDDGATQAAAALLHEAEQASGAVSGAVPWMDAEIDLAQGRLLLALGKPDDAAVVLGSAHEELRVLRNAGNPILTLAERSIAEAERARTSADTSLPSSH